MNRFTFFIFTGCFVFCSYSQEVAKNVPDTNPPAEIPGYKLVWNDEFDYEGEPDPEAWGYESGFVRNEELQWYQAENASCENHVLVLEGRRENRKNPNYVPGSSDWKKNREYIEYTSACVLTQNKKSWKYGRFEIRAKIPVVKGAWPAIWTLGVTKEWPSNGEIDILEMYRINDQPHILANAAWGTSTRWVAAWDSFKKDLYQIIEESGQGREWADNFHIWVMDWTEEYIRFYLDDVLLKQVNLSRTINPDGFNPFQQKHYLLLNLALGSNGGNPSGTTFPLRYEIDYVRVYQKEEASNSISIFPEENGIFYSRSDKETLTIKSNQQKDPAMCAIYDITGKIVLMKEITAAEELLDISSFQQGVYFVKLGRDAGYGTYKFIKI
ncbi:MAG: family 16 glycosylhydrolase [Candidatus Azobacteroides sp.]|nr:family 16 glycosylhydrolase [Candidatus Azobacteroides sp.]